MIGYEGRLQRLGGELFIIGEADNIFFALVNVAQNIFFPKLQLKQKHKNKKELSRTSFVS